MDFRSLDINVTRVFGLKLTKFFFEKKKVYIAASIVGGTVSRQETPRGRNEGKDLVWDYPMRFYVQDSMIRSNQLMLVFHVRSSQFLGGRQYIGEVYVPVKELFASNNDEMDTRTRYHTREVISPSGKYKGFLHFSCEFGSTFRALKHADDDNVKARPKREEFSASSSENGGVAALGHSNASLPPLPPQQPSPTVAPYLYAPPPSAPYIDHYL